MTPSSAACARFMRGAPAARVGRASRPGLGLGLGGLADDVGLEAPQDGEELVALSLADPGGLEGLLHVLDHRLEVLRLDLARSVDLGHRAAAIATGASAQLAQLDDELALEAAEVGVDEELLDAGVGGGSAD